MKVPNAKGSATETYVTVPREEGLAGLAQMNVLEIHPGLSFSHSTHRRIIFIVDRDEPCPGNAWRERIGSAGAAEDWVCAASPNHGGKNRMSSSTIQASFGWEQVKAFTRAFALQMEQDNSKLYITKMTKAARKNKIFVDYLRNEREATAVAPYSSRARLGMAAALPLEWAELQSAKASKFLIARFDDWKEQGRKESLGKKCCRVEAGDTSGAVCGKGRWVELVEFPRRRLGCRQCGPASRCIG